MTTPPSFPALAGLGWSVHKRPSFSTRVAPHVSGREVRAALYANTLYEFELTYNALNSDGTKARIGGTSYQSLIGLYLQCQGQFGTFLYTDPSDNTITSQLLGAGDGTTTAFTCVRNLGGYVEPVGWVTTLSNVYLAGVLQSSSTYVLTAPNVITFNSAPGASVEVSADFSYAFVCRFLDDQEDFENFMSGLWQVQSLKFRSVKP